MLTTKQWDDNTLIDNKFATHKSKHSAIAVFQVLEKIEIVHDACTNSMSNMAEQQNTCILSEAQCVPINVRGVLVIPLAKR